MAQQIPKGIAKRAVINVSKTVPIIGVKIPPEVIPSDGSLEMKSQERTLAPLENISQIITTIKKQTIKVLDKSDPHSIKLDIFLDLYGMIFSETINKILTY